MNKNQPLRFGRGFSVVSIFLTCHLGIFMVVHVSGQATRPNILFAIADDWGGPIHSGDTVLKTPVFDRLAREGARFTRAYTTASSCTPSRASALTGQMFWRLGGASNLYGDLAPGVLVYPELLEQAGYYVGMNGKGCAPGCTGLRTQPAGRTYTVDAFFNNIPASQPFCFWYGSSDPHRNYTQGTGSGSGMRAADVVLPPFWPNVDTIRHDVLDYYYEVQRFDSTVGYILTKLETLGKLENTIVVMTGDNGMPFPRFKSNSYEFSAHQPLAVRWGTQLRNPGRIIDDYISFHDFAPTFLEAAGVVIPSTMTGRSFVNLLLSNQSGRIDPLRNRAFFGKNRHTDNAPGIQAYLNQYGHFFAPQRTILTGNFLLVWNLAPSQWPSGPPPGYPDCDDALGPNWGPTKSYFLSRQNNPAVTPLFQLAFGMRPRYEFFDLRTDPWHMQNLANQTAVRDTMTALRNQLERYICDTRDPVTLDTFRLLDCDTVWQPVNLAPKSILGNRSSPALGTVENFPNPFRNKTSIRFSLLRQELVQIVVFNSSGKSVKVLHNQVSLAGTYSVQWNGTDHSGSDVQPGLYYYRIEAESFVKMGSMARIK